MGPSWPPAPTCCSTHWDTGAVSTSGAWLPQKHTRDFAHARFCTCAIGGSTMGTRVKSLVLRTLKWLLKADFVVSSGKMAR